MGGLSLLDIFILIVILLGLWRGFRVGLIQSIVSLIGWFLALVLGTRLAPILSPSFSSIVESPVLQMGVAFLAIVLLVITVLHLVAMTLKKVLDTLKLDILDKMAGGVLGAARNILVVLVMMSMASPILYKTAVWQNSKIAPDLLPYAPMAQTMLKKAFGSAWEKIDSNTKSITQTDTQ